MLSRAQRDHRRLRRLLATGRSSRSVAQSRIRRIPCITIVDALQIPNLRSLEIRTFQGLYRRDNFDPSQLPNNFKSAVTELYLNHMKRLDKTRLEGLVQSFKTLKVLEVDNCSINTGHQLMESIAKHHSQTIEVIHFGEKQKLCGSPGTRIYDIQLLSNFAKLRHLVVDLADLYNYAARWNENLQKILYLVLKLPSLEYLKIITTGSIRRNNTPSMPGGVEQGALDKALAWALRRMVNKPHRPQKVNLRTHEVYPSFDRAVMAGNEVGIVVETYGDINDDE